MSVSVLKSIMTHGMAKYLFYVRRNGFIFLILHSWFSNQIFILFVIPYHHEIIFCCNWNYSNETFGCGKISNYHKTIVLCNMTFCNETIYVAITHTAMKQFTRQLSLLTQNNLCCNWAYYHRILFVGIGLVVMKVYAW
jgi:hypothetical protein